MKKVKKTQTKKVRIWTGNGKWKLAVIDKCMAPLVKELQQAGLKLKDCHCGSALEPAQIVLASGAKMHVST